MIVDERMVTFINSMELPEESLLEEIEREALESFVPIIRTETKSLLKVLLTVKRPMRILEVGTAVGYSALVMAAYAPEGSKITTIENYDFIFMDAAKGQYIHYLPEVMRLLDAGGLLVSDNVLQDGDLINSRFAVERRNRTIHSRMREYLFELKHRGDLETTILPVGDGVALSVKRQGTLGVRTEKEKRWRDIQNF